MKPADEAPRASTVQQLVAGLPGGHVAWPLLLCTLLAALPGLQLGWVCAPALLWIARALWLRRDSVELPPRVGGMPVGPAAARRLTACVTWLHARMNRWCRPRWHAALRAGEGKPAAALVAAMGAIILLPLPASNFLPSLALVALVPAMLVRDGLAMVLAWTLALLSVALMALVVILGMHWITGW